MKKRFIAFAALTFVVAFVLSGCIFMDFDESDRDYTSKTRSESTSIERNDSLEASLLVSDESSVDESGVEEPSIEESSDEQPIPPQDEPSVPDEPETYIKIYTLLELRDYLNENKNNDDLTVEFTYLGTEEFDAQLVARMTNSFYITCNWIGNDYTVEMMEFPGDRIVDAYFSGDDSFLNDDEKLVLDKALQIVAAADQETDNDYDLEIYLHDYLAETITYYSPFLDVSDPSDPPRHLTSVGGLLDESANCQGYTDSFYVLASIAGLKVGRMSAVDNNGEGHMLNTILLNGKWYVVDVTFDDVLFGSEDETNYRLFNAGEDMCDEYSWIAEYEYNQIAENSDELYYYNRVGESFNTLDEMTDSIVEDWLSGKTEFHMMLSGQAVDWDALNDILYNALEQTQRSFSYNILSCNTNDDTFFIIRFNE